MVVAVVGDGDFGYISDIGDISSVAISSNRLNFIKKRALFQQTTGEIQNFHEKNGRFL